MAGVRFTHETLGQRVVLGSGLAATAVAEEVARLDARRVMLVASAGGRGHGDLVAAGLASGGVEVVLRWTEVPEHVPVELAERARAAALASRVDAVVGVGGGSVTGLAKAVTLAAPVRLVAVPTTYAGSEATDVWGLTEAGEKRTGRDPRVLPAAVVYDAELTTSLPAGLTVSSGLNALAHCVDSLWAPRTDPIAVALALEGARSLATGLPAAVADGQDLGAREDLLAGAYLAAVSFAAAGSGLHHKVCHVLGGTFGLPHAGTHAVVLPHVLALNAPAVPALARRLAGAFGGSSDPVDALDELQRGLGAPTSLAELGLPGSALAEATRLCLAVVPPGNPVAVTEAVMSCLIRRAWAGEPSVADG